jgi:RimJ/RimL family protein N-acetyltransferase
MNAQQYYEKEILRNGLEVIIRAVRPDDVVRIIEAFKELEAESIYTRFFSPKREITETELQRIRETDFDTLVRLLCITERDGREIVIAEGIYAKTSDESAEVAFIVEEDYQCLGIAKRLLTHLGRIALANGIKEFTAQVLPYNSAMLNVFRNSGCPMKSHMEEEVVYVTLDLESS